MAKDHRPKRQNKVAISVAVDIVDLCSISTLDKDRVATHRAASTGGAIDPARHALSRVIKGFVGVRAALAAATFTPRGLRTAVEAGVIGEGVTGLLTAVVVVAAGGGSRRFGISTAFTTASGDDD